VLVSDPGLAQLRAIMASATGQPAPPNHHGTVDHVEDGLVYINFDDDGVEGAGNQAPYPVEDVWFLVDE
jgi:hypothetical protein